MESAIVRNLRPEFEPVAVVWSDMLPADVVQFKEGKFGCTLYLFAHACRRGKITGGSRKTIACDGGRAALGLDPSFATSDLETYAAVFSKGLKSVRDQARYQKRMNAAPKRFRHLYEYGERRHCSYGLAEAWLLHGLPRYENPHEYVLFEPLHLVPPEENVRVVIFPVNPLELSGLITLAGSVMEGTDPVQVPPGPDCTSITAFAYAQADLESPRAVLGMQGVQRQRGHAQALSGRHRDAHLAGAFVSADGGGGGRLRFSNTAVEGIAGRVRRGLPGVPGLQYGPVSFAIKEGESMKALLILFALISISAFLGSVLQGQTSEFDGLYLNMGNLPRLSHAKTRSISPESFTGEKGQGGMATEGTGSRASRDLGQGWKVSPSVNIESKQTFTLAEINGSGAIQQIWMTPTGHWRFSILRIYWDGEAEPSVEVPVGDFFANGWGKYAQDLVTARCRQSRQCVQLLLGDALP